MRKTVEKNPLDFRHRLILGNFYNAARRFHPEYLNRAEVTLTKAVELSPNNPQAYTSLGQTYLFGNENEKAFELLQKAIDLEPGYSRSSLNLAESYVMMGEYREGSDLFEELLNKDKFPTTTYYMSRLIFAYEQLGEYDKAIAWSKEITESEAGKSSASAHFQLAELYKGGGYLDEAKEAALEAKGFEPGADLKKEIEKFLEEL